MTCLHLSTCWTLNLSHNNSETSHIYRGQITWAFLTARIVTGHRELHGRLVLHVDNVVPLDRIHVAQLLTGELDSSVENLCKVKDIVTLFSAKTAAGMRAWLLSSVNWPVRLFRRSSVVPLPVDLSKLESTERANFFSRSVWPRMIRRLSRGIVRTLLRAMRT